MTDIWEGLLNDEEKAVYDVFAVTHELGRRPALLLIDVNYAWVGVRDEPITDAIGTFDTACGPTAWAAVAQMQRLVATARECGIPLVYTTTMAPARRRPHFPSRDRGPEMGSLYSQDELDHERHGTTIVAEVAPQPNDIVLEKYVPSGFCGTPLVLMLNEMDVDTVIVVGGSTSGCVRATVVDAASYGFYAGVVSDGVFDRFQLSHRVSLFDMDAKYARVIDADAADTYLRKDAERVLPL